VKLALFFLLCIPAWPQSGIPGHPRELKYGPLEYAPPRAADFRHKLSNGAVAFLVPKTDLPLVRVSVLVRTGEYLEPEGQAGLAQLTGSQMRAGGTKTRPPAEFDEEAAFLAAIVTSNIGSTQGGASLDCLKKDIDQGLALFADMLRNPGFAEDRLKLAKTQMLQAMQRRNDSTASIEAREFGRLLRGDRHFSTRENTRASIESITRQDLADFHSRWYYPANFVFAVSGDFEVKEMLARLEKMLAGWPNRSEAAPSVPAPEFTPKPGVYVVHKDVNQGRVRMGHLGGLFSNPDHIAINVMNRILGGGGFVSHIMARVRSDEGLAYQAGSSYSHGDYYPGTFAAVFQSRSATVPQAIAIVKEEIERMRSGKITREELEIHTTAMVESLPQQFGSAAAQAARFATDYYLNRPEDYWAKYRERVRSVMPEDVQRVAQKYLQPDKLVILVVGNAEAILKGNPDKPQYSLASFGPVVRIPLPDPMTMVYPSASQ
jgi:predicted Zn-dependent peptidase